MTDSAPASGTGRHAAPAQGRHRAPDATSAHRLPDAAPAHRPPDATPVAAGRPGSRLLVGRLRRIALAGVAVATLAAGVLVATSSADTPAHPAAAPPAGTRSPLSGPAQLSAGAPRGATLLTATPVHARRPAPATPAAVSALAATGIPAVALNAYRLAAARLASADPGCGVHWSLLAGIGRVESNHGRYGGATLTANGESRPPIIGPALDGTGATAYIADTDGGRLDGDPRVDHAVGPMQFIPATWASYGVDGNGDGVAEPLQYRRRRPGGGPLPVRGRRRPAHRRRPAPGGAGLQPLRRVPGAGAGDRAGLRHRHSPGRPGPRCQHRPAAAGHPRLAAAGEPGPAGRDASRRPARPVPAVRRAAAPPAAGHPATVRPAAVRPAARPEAIRVAGRPESGTGSSSSGTGSSGNGSSGNGSSGSGSSGGGQPAPSGPATASPSTSASQPPPSGIAGLPVPSVSVPPVLPSPTGTGCVKVVLGIAVPVPCGSS